MRILHLFGSTPDDFHFDLSKMYAEAALRPAGTEHAFAAVTPDGRWRRSALRYPLPRRSGSCPRPISWCRRWFAGRA